jgi:hypothetical protein
LFSDAPESSNLLPIKVETVMSSAVELVSLAEGAKCLFIYGPFTVFPVSQTM